MLFVIARDNECEDLVEEKLVLCRDWFELLFLFIKSEYEYTSRMALRTMNIKKSWRCMYWRSSTHRD